MGVPPIFWQSLVVAALGRALGADTVTDTQTVLALWGSILTVATAGAACVCALAWVELSSLRPGQRTQRRAARDRLEVCALLAIVATVAAALCWGWLFAL